MNAVTGKRSRGDRYAAATVAHCETVLRGFYDFHLEAGTGPMVNPFPLARHARPGGRMRTTTRWSRSPRQRSGRYRPKVVHAGAAAHPGRAVRRVVRAAGLAPGPGAGRVLGLDRGAGLGAAGRHGRRCRPGQQLITVIRKGTRALQQLPASPDAFVWLRLYQAQLHGLVPAGRDEPLWWTLRRPFRPLTYHAARAMFTRANAALGANWSLHDLRHTAAYRMARDPQMPLTDVQWVLGHAHLSTTQLYLTPVTEDVIAGVLAHHARQREPRPGARRRRRGYRPETPGDPVRRGRVSDRPRRPATAAPATVPRPRRRGRCEPTGGAAAGRVPAAAGRRVAGRRPGQPVAQVLARVLAAPFALDNRLSQQTRRRACWPCWTGWQTQPGDTWQQRWLASGAEDRPGLAGPGRRRGRRRPRHHGPAAPHLSPALLVLICADVIRPSLGWLLRFAPARRSLAAEMARTRDPAGVRRAGRAVHAAAGSGCRAGQQALSRIAVIMAAKGGPVATSRVGDCLELLETAAGTRATDDRHAHSPLFYQLLRAHGDPRPGRARRDARCSPAAGSSAASS